VESLRVPADPLEHVRIFTLVAETVNERLWAAIRQAHAEGVSVRSLARATGIPATTLDRKLKEA